jgi:hypothetical protein
MTAFFRFPHTPHLAWMGADKPRADKVLSPSEAQSLLIGDVVVEEKVDGANLGFSVDELGNLRAQNRGSYLDLDAPHGQWKPLKRWLLPRKQALADVLRLDLVLFGEWCYAVHSVRYSKLPDWFLAFDVYDRAKAEFWSADRRNELVARVDVAVVPELGRGRFDLAGLKRLLGRSHLTDGPAEGLYVRCETQERLIARAKLVRAEFTQAIDEHWSKRTLEANRLAPGR